jgi:1,4-alpha-glucan branching enzyme
MSLKKQHLKTRPVCKVTFRVPSEAVNGARTVHVVGEFNNWDIDAAPMKKLKNGSFTLTMDLEQGREYQFRYLIDGATWENDWKADCYIPSPYGDCDNSVIIA